MAGRLPSENPIRRNARVGPTVLPSAGRSGPAPEWPFDSCSPAETTLWTDLWKTPQSVVWDHYGWTRVVARYVRCVLLAEMMEKDALAEARQLEDRLGLTPKAMRALLWTISVDEVAEKRQEAPAATVRGRLKAI